MINITVNNIKYSYPYKLTLNEVIIEQSIETNGVAIAVNQNVIPKLEWSSFQLNEGDEILIISATQGG